MKAISFIRKLLSRTSTASTEKYYLVKVNERFGRVDTMTRFIVKAQGNEEAEKFLLGKVLPAWKFGKLGKAKQQGKIFFFNNASIRLQPLCEIDPVLAQQTIDARILNVLTAE